MGNPKCEVCNERESIGVCCVPGVPYSAAYCRECLAAGAQPYHILVANTACCSGLEHCNDYWKKVVDTTLQYIGKSEEEFQADVALSIKDMDERNQAEGTNEKTE